jgi:hypothetical protein
MSAFQTYRPLVVDANQCKSEMTIAADNGFRHVRRGEWIIRGENGECYVVDDSFFKRTFEPVEDAVMCGQAAEGRHYGS